MVSDILNTGNIFIFEKNRYGKYLKCNEAFASIAGVDSPAKIEGLYDDDLIWCDQAEHFRFWDRRVLMAHEKMVNEPEPVIQEDRVAQNLTTKLATKNDISVVGSSVDISDYLVVKKMGYYDNSKERFYLGEYFNQAYFTKKEYEVFKYLLLGLTTNKISELLSVKDIVIPKKVIESHTAKIMQKLQCANKYQIISVAVRNGLSHILY